MVHTGPRQPSATDWVQTLAQIQMASQTAQIAEAQRQQLNRLDKQLAHQAQQQRIEEELRERRIQQQVEMNWLVETDEALSKFPDVSNWYNIGDVPTSLPVLFNLLVNYINKFERQRIHEIFENIEDIKFARKVMTAHQSLTEGILEKLGPEAAKELRLKSEIYLNGVGRFHNYLVTCRATPILSNLKRDITKEKNDLPSNVSKLRSKKLLKILQRDEIISGSSYTNKIRGNRLLIMLATVSLIVGHSSLIESLPIIRNQAIFISGISLLFALLLTHDAELNSVNKEILRLYSDEEALSQRIEEMEREYDDLWASTNKQLWFANPLVQSPSTIASRPERNLESVEELINFQRVIMKWIEDIVNYIKIGGGLEDAGFSSLLDQVESCIPPG